MIVERCQVGFVWITPSDEDFQAKKVSAKYHLGCAYLSAYLLKQGIASKQYLVNSISPQKLAENVVADGIRVLGFSVKDTNYYAVRWVATAVKELDSSILIVSGGLTATFSDELILKYCPSIDTCIRGYAELNLYTLVRSFLLGREWHKTPGLSVQKNKETIRNPDVVRDIGKTLDYFPSPYLTGVLPGESGLQVGLSTSRGCVFRCTFCNPTAMAGFNIAYHSDKRVIEELALIDSAVENIGSAKKQLMLLNEDIFALNLKRTKRLCDRIAQNPPKNFFLGCETRIEHLNQQVLESMYSAGFRFLKFGLESGNPRVLNLINKVRTTDGSVDNYESEREFLKQIAAVVQIAKSTGFRVAAGAIFGLPGEKLEDTIDTLDFLRRIDVDEYYHNFLHLFPGTEIFRTYRNWGYRLEVREDFYPTIYRTYWPYPVELVPMLPEKLDRPFRRDLVHL